MPESRQKTVRPPAETDNWATRSVYPPNGRVRISAPARMNLDTIRVFAISKLSWIKQQQKKLQEQKHHIAYWPPEKTTANGSSTA
jgi:predicted metal-dependent hydrolase